MLMRHAYFHHAPMLMRKSYALLDFHTLLRLHIILFFAAESMPVFLI